MDLKHRNGVMVSFDVIGNLGKFICHFWKLYEFHLNVIQLICVYSISVSEYVLSLCEILHEGRVKIEHL